MKAAKPNSRAPRRPSNEAGAVRSGEPSPSRRYVIAVAALVLLGALIYIPIELSWEVEKAQRALARAVELRVIAAALMLTVVGAMLGRDARVAQPVGRIVKFLQTPSPRRRTWTAVAIALGSAIYLWSNAVRQEVPLDLRVHDENMYMVQSQMLARGRLWMPPHPHGEFFESFHVFAKPVYAPMYFPGTALFYAVPVRLGLPTWVFSVALCGLAVGLTYVVIALLTDGLAGIIGALCLLAISQFRAWAVAMMSHPLLLVFGLAMFLCILRWRHTRGVKWIALAGGFAGWALITRPLDALCYIAPLGAMVLWGLKSETWRVRLRTAALAMLAAAPFVSLQLVQNVGITGKLLKNPVQLAMETYWPEMQLGWKPPPEGVRLTRLPSRWLPQYQAFYIRFMLPQVLWYNGQPFHQLLRYRMETLLHHSLPSRMLIVILLVSVVGLRDPRRLVLWAVVPIFFAAYFFFAFFLFHYVLAIAPVMILSVFIAIECIKKAAGRAGTAASGFLLVAVALLALNSLPEFRSGEPDQFHVMPTLRDVNAQLSRLPANERALVFFTYHDEVPNLWQEEPVYNLDAAWPDDARIVRAHDLGPPNMKLVEYYARRQPDRRVYMYDLQSRQLTAIGVAGELVKKPGT